MNECRLLCSNAPGSTSSNKRGAVCATMKHNPSASQTRQSPNLSGLLSMLYSLVMNGKTRGPNNNAPSSDPNDKLDNECVHKGAHAEAEYI